MRVVVSGDLTQRARRSQFAAARAYLGQLPAPRLVVPGNHDVPLYDLLRRFAQPLTRYRAFIDPDPEPVFEDEELMVIGISTARSRTWKGGRISLEQIERVRRRVCAAPPKRLRVLVAHHPFAATQERPSQKIVGRALKALSALDACGVDLILTGHLHRRAFGDPRSHHHTLSRSLIALHAGSAISHRLRGEPNSYNLVRLEDGSLEVEVRAFDGRAFAPAGLTRFTRQPGGWLREPALPAVP